MAQESSGGAERVFTAQPRIRVVCPLLVGTEQRGASWGGTATVWGHRSYSRDLLHHMLLFRSSVRPYSVSVESLPSPTAL